MSNIEHDSLWKVVKFEVELEVGGVRLIEKQVMKEVFSWMDTTVVQIHCQGVTLLLDVFFYHQAKRPVMLKHKYVHNNSRIIKIMIVASPDGGIRRKKSLSLLWYQ